MSDTRIDPIKTSEYIQQTYLRYLITTFGLKNPQLARQFQELAQHSEGLFRGPVLEATPQYRKGKSPLELLTEPQSFLSEEFLNYAPGLDEHAQKSCLPLERALYSHQEQALEKILTKNRNIVVATGTGSGKTECFLLPIINYLLRERVAKRLGAGVRALLLYPMNALANDQVARLRRLLPPETGITFGRYTGQTLQEYSQGLEAFKQENGGKIPQANELFCRNQILGMEPEKKELPYRDYPIFLGPPHILLTNFAMLEYLLMRPQDSVLFDADAGKSWRFLVLDEAHIYTGATGTEIAYLIRRLKERICRSQKGKILCIATSATIGAHDDNSKKTLATSFQNLFGERFEAQDVITGDVVPPEEIFKPFPVWGKGGGAFYQTLSDIRGNSCSSLVESIQEKILPHASTDKESGWPAEETITRVLEVVNTLAASENARELVLFHFLVGDLRMRTLIKELENAPLEFQKATETLWGTRQARQDKDALKEQLIQLVDLGSKARLSPNSAPLLAARYHFFVRSLEGLSICLVRQNQKQGQSNWPKLFLGRHREIPDAPGGKATAFELRACGRCGQSFLHGCLLDDGRFVSYPRRTRLEENFEHSSHQYTYLSIALDEVVESAEDEEALQDALPPVSGEEEDKNGGKKIVTARGTVLSDEQYMCARCGYLTHENLHACEYCRKHESRVTQEWVTVRKVKPTKGHIVRTCPACGGQKNFGASIIRAFSPGDDAAGAVLTQSLMTKIPATSERPLQEQQEDARKPKSRFAVAEPTAQYAGIFGKARLLAFSDSRQDAAYFASYLNRTSNQVLHRQLILRAIKKLLKENSGIQSFDPNDLVLPLILEAQGVGLFTPTDTDLSRRSEVNKWLVAELAGISRRYGLEGVGLISWELKYRQELLQVVRPHQEGLQAEYHVNADEFVTLLEVFLTELRRQNVLEPLYNVNIRDSYFWPRNRPYTIRPNHVHTSLSIASWQPQAARNIRSDYIERVFSRIGIKAKKQVIEKLLHELWELSLNVPIWKEVPSVNTLWGGSGNDGVVWRIRWDAWAGRLLKAKDGDSLYKCDTCGNLSYLHLKNTCPTYRCLGQLVPVDPEIEFINNHYRSIYESSPVPIHVLEHTAQITTQEGAKRQRKFSEDHDSLNILSCSTTFELGVDVGELHSVFLRNVPPTIANYVQRSGRAGRRLSAAAFVLTFCRNRPHDLGYFDVVNKLISGKVQPTKVSVDNIRIARRHLHAVVLSRFWRLHPQLFNGPHNRWRGSVQWLFFEPQQTAAQLLYDWLQQKPEELIQEVIRIFPQEISRSLEVNSWQWVHTFVDKSQSDTERDRWEGGFGLAQTELRSEYQDYEKLQDEIRELYNYAKAQMKRIKERQILDFLASRNVLPKYGFPVDVVPLKLQSTDDWAQRLELNRDLRLALSEYAPGCTLVANGKVIKSYALERVAGRAWPEYRFRICSQCGKFHHSESSHGTLSDICECGQTLTGSEGTLLDGKFIIPIYGFKTNINEDGQEPVEIRPQRTFATRVFFSRYKTANEESPFLNEGVADSLVGLQVHKRYARDGMLSIINPGKSNRGFWICRFCGYGESAVSKPPKNHKTPWGKPCNGSFSRVFLGHEFQSDVLELRFIGASAEQYDQGFWLSLTAALLAGAAKALDIERDDIDGTILRIGGEGYRSIVLFDNVPGGAGHVRRISQNLQHVMEEAFNISENCPSCSRDQSCNSCLRNYRNQYAHDLLKRGPVADFLSRLLSGLYRKDQDGYFPLGLTDCGRWFEQQMRRAQKIDVVLTEIPAYAQEYTSGRNWYNILNDVASKESSVRIFLTKELQTSPQIEPEEKVAFHSLALLSQFQNVEIYTNSHLQQPQAYLYLEVDSTIYAVRWKPGSNPFSEPTAIELSVLETFTRKVKEQFDSLARHDSSIHWNLQQLENLLQGTKVIQVKSGSKQSWEEILLPYLPNSLQAVEIYDRYLRNRYQLKSLEMFLDALLLKASSHGISIKITTTDENNDRTRGERFKNLQHLYAHKNIKLHYTILEPSRDLPHFRRVQISSKEGKCSLWLDKGLDIFEFKDLTKPTFSTIETYIVVEYN